MKLSNFLLEIREVKGTYNRDDGSTNFLYKAVVPADFPGRAGVGVSFFSRHRFNPGDIVQISSGWVNNRVVRDGDGMRFYLTLDIPPDADVVRR